MEIIHVVVSIHNCQTHVSAYFDVFQDPTGIFWREERLRLEANRERKEEHLFLTARVTTDDTVTRCEGFNLATFDGKN